MNIYLALGEKKWQTDVSLNMIYVRAVTVDLFVSKKLPQQSIIVSLANDGSGSDKEEKLLAAVLERQDTQESGIYDASSVLFSVSFPVKLALHD